MGKNDDFVMTIEDDQDIVVDEPMEEIEEDKVVVKKPMDKKMAKKMRKLANREKKQGLQATIKADTEKKKKAEKDSAFDSEFTFSMDGGSGVKGGTKDWDFTAARSMLKGKQVCPFFYLLLVQLLIVLYRVMLIELQSMILLLKRDKKIKTRRESLK